MELYYKNQNNELTNAIISGFVRGENLIKFIFYWVEFTLGLKGRKVKQI